ncbi:MAG: DNA primase, partial [Gammaproteobacteria bacterium]
MAGKIPQQFIDDLLSRVDIVDVIEADIPLKKAGKDFQALCPFHGEKTPSFTVSQEKQFYHCFGCGVHGSALGFVMNHRGMNFVEAVEELAQSVGMQMPERDTNAINTPDYTPLFTALEKAQTFFAQQLRAHPQKARAVDYLKSRGLTGKVAKQFELGFSPDSWDDLFNYLKQENVSQKNMIEAGLVVAKSENKVYDRFRDRVMFPIRDRRGRVVAFGGRIIDKGEPKYLNSPETPVFQKRRELYGLYNIRQANVKTDRIIVVEGYMDVVGLAQFGVQNTVATLGTAPTTEQLETLYKITSEVVFCYDA